MYSVLNFFLAAYLVSTGLAPIPSTKPTHPHLMTTAWDDQSTYDAHAEQELLEFANRARAQAQLPSFRTDDGLVQAARIHAKAMAERQAISHQFPGEAELYQRLAASSSLYLVEAAENVALAESADRAHDALMHSVHHRENLLHPAYNVVGIGVVRRGDILYVVQDFGDSLAKVSADESESIIKEGIGRLRRKGGLRDLQFRDAESAHKDACNMAAADSLKIAQSALIAQARHVIRYTTLQPGSFPSTVSQAAADSGLRSYAAGSCFARSKSYPNGIYWVVLVFY